MKTIFIHKSCLNVFPYQRLNGYLILLSTFLLLALESCSSSKSTSRGVIKATSKKDKENKEDKKESDYIKSTVSLKEVIPARTINTKDIPADEVVKFAETLIGTPYKYGSTIKENGFDCSGFINYVFNNFKIKVPRSSKDFTNAGKQIDLENCKRGDLILFTGSNANSGVVGHMGIITYNKKGKIEFIHAASSNSKGVIISGMNQYFIPRFVKVIRVFNVI